MPEEACQENFFWDTYPWNMSDKSGSPSGEGRTEEKYLGEKNLIEPNIGNGHSRTHSPMKQQEGVTITVASGSKRNTDAIEIKKEDDMKLSRSHNDHDLHILTERERRKKMRNMFNQLHALIPHLPPKTDKSTIVDEAVSYIQTLQQTLQKLETKKLEKVYGQSSCSTTVSPLQSPKPAFDTRESFLADQGSSTSHFGMVSPSSLNSFSFPISSPTVFQTWASPNVTLNVCGMNAYFNICSSPKPGLFTAICFVLEKYKVEIVSAETFSNQTRSLFMIHAHVNTRDQTGGTFPYDEIYKQVATEIMHWVSSKSP